MNKPINLNQIASTIADTIKQGVDIHVYLKKDVFDSWHIVVSDPVTSSSVHLIFTDAEVQPAEQDKQDACHLPPVPAVAQRKPAVSKKHDSRWWSRFNFEKNIMKMTLLALQDRYPGEQSFPQSTFANKLATMMSWETSTAKRHITQAAKMGILNRAIVGTAYHIAGMNDVDADTAREELPDIEPLPDEDKPAMGSAFAHEGRIQFEQEFENAVDETILP